MWVGLSGLPILIWSVADDLPTVVQLVLPVVHVLRDRDVVAVYVVVDAEITG